MDPIHLEGDLNGVLFPAAGDVDWGVVVVSGTSGRLETARARLFAEHGVTALALQWFGGDGQSPGICMIDLAVFRKAIDRLKAAGCRRVAMLGLSKGAEAALLMACRDDRLDLVIALAPSSVAWAATAPGLDGFSWFARSSWIDGGDEVPFVPIDPRWRPIGKADGVRFREMFERSLATFANDVPRASIPIETARADVILVASGDDAIWPSGAFAIELAARRTRAGRSVQLLFHAEAGHRPLFPGETAAEAPEERALGGHEAADAELGVQAWPAIAQALGIARK